MPFIRPARFYRFNQVQSAPPPPPPPPPPPLGGTEILITKMTVTNTENSAQTNQVVEFGLPVSADALVSGVIRVYDDDGAGGLGTQLANFQQDNNSVSISGAVNGNVRFCKVTGIIPSIAASATRFLQVWRTSANPITSFTPISLADVSALAGATNGLIKAELDLSGVSHSASVFDIIVNGSSTYHKAARWYSSDTWRSGPTCTEWRMRMAPRAGTTPHLNGSGVHVEFHLAAFKAGIGAVSAANPIMTLRCDTILKNADAARTSAAVRQHFYGLQISRATSPTDATMITTDVVDPELGTHRQSYTSKNPAAVLTLSNQAVGSRTATLGTGTWDSDITGAYITEVGASGVAIVTSANSTTQVQMWVWEAFSTAAPQVSAWAQIGVGHPYNSEWPIRQWIGNNKKTLARWGDSGNALNPTSAAALEYAKQAKALLNYRVSAGEVSFSMTQLNNMKSDGLTIRPFSNRGDYGTVLFIGDSYTYLGSTSDRQDIGPNQGEMLYGLAKNDASGQRKIFENATLIATNSYFAPEVLSGSPTNGSLGLIPRHDNGIDYHWSDGVFNRNINRPTKLDSVWHLDGAAHIPNAFLIPYLLTGDMYWMQQAQRQAAYTNYIHPQSIYNGNTAQRTAMGAANGITLAAGDYPFGSTQVRAQAWGARDAVVAAFVTPYSARPTLFNTWSAQADHVAKNWTAAKLWGEDDFSNSYQVSGPHYLSTETGEGYAHWPAIGRTPVHIDAYWAQAWHALTLNMAFELGFATSAAVSHRNFISPKFTSIFSEPDFVADVFSNAFYGPVFASGMYGPVSSYAQLYKVAALYSPLDPRTPIIGSRQTTTKATLSSNTSGAGRTITFTTPVFGSADPWYVSGYISEYPQTGIPYTDVGLAQITSVKTSNIAEITILQPFTSASPPGNSAQTLVFPGIKPEFYASEATSFATGEYWVGGIGAIKSQFTDGVRALANFTVSGAASVASYQEARGSYSETTWRKIAIRTS